jgi:hypothetical protein
MNLSKSSVVVSAGTVVDAEIGNEVLVLQLKKAEYFGLQETGARIWSLLKSPVTVEDIERVLLEEYEVDAAVCHREVVQLLSDLIEEGLVEVRS